MSEVLIDHKVSLDNGVAANTVAPSEVIDAMYPANIVDSAEVYITELGADSNGLALTGVNSVLRFQDLPNNKKAILGNTVTRGCAVAQDCGNCVLAGLGLTISDMAEQNCARANTARVFEFAEEEPHGRFVLLPTKKEAFVVNDGSFKAEYNGAELMQNRLQAASSVVFTESWLRKHGLDRITIGMNGADGSFGVATTVIAGETLIIPFCSMRQNMGDREEQDQILRQAFDAYFDQQDFNDNKRHETLNSLDISIVLSASASLANFAHKIKVPDESPEAPERERKEAARLRQQYSDLVSRAGGKITSAIVLNDQYPGAMDRGSIFPELEAKLGIHKTPITPGNCPGDGQTCHIDYRTETKYALVRQLEQMGVPTENINYDDSKALDPASPLNKMASNRAEQNEGVAVANTNRTLNAMTIGLQNSAI